MIIHSTMAMQTAWKMYEKLGFKRSGDLDFIQGELPVYGFRLVLYNGENSHHNFRLDPRNVLILYCLIRQPGALQPFS